MRHAFRFVWFDRARFLPCLLAVAFSHVLMTLQAGVLVGCLATVSLPIDVARATVWVTARDLPSCDLGRPISLRWVERLWSVPGVRQAEPYIQSYHQWECRDGRNELVVVAGCEPTGEPISPAAALARSDRRLLTEPGAAILARGTAARLGIRAVGDGGKIGTQRLRVVALVEGLEGFTAPYVFVSLATARRVFGSTGREECTFALAAGDHPDLAARVREMLPDDEVSVYAADVFSRSTRQHWLTTTNAGLALGFVSLLGLTIGVLIASEAMSAAVAGSAAEYATLRALGVGLGRLRLLVLQQALLVGLAGVALGTALAIGLGQGVVWAGVPVAFAPALLGTTAAVTLASTQLAGLLALRALRATDPTRLLR